MAAPLISADVRLACTLLFGRAEADNPTFLLDLCDAELKRHYRQQVKRCHPDRARQLGRKESQLVIEFRRIDRSYKCLKAFLQRRGPPGGRRATNMFAGRRRASQAPVRPAPQDNPRPKARSRQQQHRRRSSMAGHQHESFRSRSKHDAGRKKERFQSTASGHTHHHAGQQHSLPDRRMLLAEFLYHKGLINRTQLIDALVWQRRQRPMIGQLAVDWGYMGQVDVKRILEQKQAGERFGEAARRLGYLSVFQHFALLGKQKGMQQRIGNYFTERHILDAKQIDDMVEALHEHNRKKLFNQWQ